MTHAPQQPTAKRPPDCVTELRKGNTILTVSGYFKQDATETAVDKMEKVIAAENMAGRVEDLKKPGATPPIPQNPPSRNDLAIATRP